VESRHEIVTTYYAGAATGFLFLASVYLHELGVVDLVEGSAVTTVFTLLMFLPFILFVVRKTFKDIWALIWRDEVKPKSVVASATKRFWRFAGGLLLVFVPGAFVLFALIA
jgi:hypothetical protein